MLSHSGFGGRGWIQAAKIRAQRGCGLNIRLRAHISPLSVVLIGFEKKNTSLSTGVLVGEGGFEPPKSATTDLQSAPFGHSGTLPYEVGAGGRTRTPDLLITNQLLYQLSYTSVFNSSTARVSLSEKRRLVNTKF